MLHKQNLDHKQRTQRKPKMEQEVPGFRPSELARAIVSSPRFTPSSFETERPLLFNQIEDEMIDFVEDAAFNLNAGNNAY